MGQYLGIISSLAGSMGGGGGGSGGGSQQQQTPPPAPIPIMNVLQTGGGGGPGGGMSQIGGGSGAAPGGGGNPQGILSALGQVIPGQAGNTLTNLGQNPGGFLSQYLQDRLSPGLMSTAQLSQHQGL
jgi:hypothetical protein